MQHVLLLQCQSSQAVLALPTKVVPVVYSDFTFYWTRNLESAVIVYRYINRNNAERTDSTLCSTGTHTPNYQSFPFRVLHNCSRFVRSTTDTTGFVPCTHKV